MTERCRHSRSWLIAGASIEWCHECGAFRLLVPVKGSTNTVASHSVWCKPGQDFDEWQQRSEAYRRRRGRA